MDVLLVCLELDGERYGIPAAHVAEVVPAVPLRVVPGVREGIVGLLRFRGRVVPVVDLALAWGGAPSPRRMSTRIVVSGELGPAADGRVPRAAVGVLAEHVTSVSRVDPDAAAAGEPPATPGARGLGRLVHDGDRLLQLVRPSDLLDRDLLDALVREAPRGRPRGEPALRPPGARTTRGPRGRRRRRGRARGRRGRPSARLRRVPGRVRGPRGRRRRRATRLVADLLVHETSFFRYPASFDALAAFLAPARPPRPPARCGSCPPRARPARSRCPRPWPPSRPASRRTGSCSTPWTCPRTRSRSRARRGTRVARSAACRSSAASAGSRTTPAAGARSRSSATACASPSPDALAPEPTSRRGLRRGLLPQSPGLSHRAGARARARPRASAPARGRPVVRRARRGPRRARRGVRPPPIPRVRSRAPAPAAAPVATTDVVVRAHGRAVREHGRAAAGPRRVAAGGGRGSGSARPRPAASARASRTAAARPPAEASRGPTLSRARAAADAGRLDEARALVEEVVRTGPPSADAYHLLAVVCRAAGASRLAEEALTRALYLDPGHRRRVVARGAGRDRARRACRGRAPARARAPRPEAADDAADPRRPAHRVVGRRRHRAPARPRGARGLSRREGARPRRAARGRRRGPRVGRWRSASATSGSCSTRRACARSTSRRRSTACRAGRTRCSAGSSCLRGELHLCADLYALLGCARDAAAPTARRRMVVIERDGDPWAFEADEVYDVHRYDPASVAPSQVTVAKAVGAVHGRRGDLRGGRRRARCSTPSGCSTGLARSLS